METLTLQTDKTQAPTDQRLDRFLVPSLSARVGKQIVCIAGLGPSCGKSVIATNLAYLLSQEGVHARHFHSEPLETFESSLHTRTQMVIVEIKQEVSRWYSVAHETLLITDPSRLNGSTIEMAHHFLRILNQTERPVHVRLLVNRANNFHHAKKIYNLIRKAALEFPLIHLKYFGFLPKEPLLETWTARNKKFVAKYPDSVTTAVLRGLMLRLKYHYELWRY